MSSTRIRSSHPTRANPFLEEKTHMKKIATKSLVGIAAVVLFAAEASAQMCNGTAAFSVGKMRAGVGSSFPSNATSFDGEFAYGAASGMYGGVTVSMLDAEGAPESATVFGVNGGKALTVGAKKNVEVCPQILASFGSYPGDVSTMDIGGGVTFGTTLDASKSFGLQPFGGAYLVRNSIEAAGFEGSDTNLSLALGAGFIFSKKWTVRPVMNIPVTADGAETTFGIMGSLNFGKR